ncbi:MAG: DNA/RNA non-specific endonuclease [Clostridia bacterium]|nr:DNA/RNA non-specific endonuclease [Clostridia bacterium]
MKFGKIRILLIVFVLTIAAAVSLASDCSLSDLDSLGRAGTASAILGPETIPGKDRSPISMFYPSGFRPSIKYDFIDGKYLYNRCHLIAFQLCGVDDERNLFTGTRYLNIHLMLPIENEVRRYIDETGHHVQYTVTTDFWTVKQYAAA